MPTPSNELERQVEAAFDFRGHVTIAFKSGETVEGFLFNREYANPLTAEENYIDVILKDSDQRRRYPIAALESVRLTGADHAAGNSFEDYLKKQKKA
ncbi:MAG: hypothetical protein HY554_12350 [Elusimicrobia bacterium]|nr:hypothetical protein [Elusimicrobiota bacterium]